MAGTQRLPRTGRRLGLGGADAELLGHAPHHRRRLVAVHRDEPQGPRNYLPNGPVRFDRAVDSVSRSLLGRRATADCIKAAAQLVQLAPTATIKSREDFGDWRAVPLIATVLNSPEHLRK